MREAIRKIFGKSSGHYDSYSDFALHASKTEKKKLIQRTIREANKLQRETANTK